MMTFKKSIFFCAVLLTLLVVLDLSFGISPYWYLLPLSLLGLFIVVGSFVMSYDFFLSSFVGQAVDSKAIVAITFDDGPNPNYTPKVLDLLERYNQKATFFCIGKEVEKHPEIVARIHRAGHSLGNHSYSHHKLIGFNSAKKWLEELHKTDKALKSVTAKSTKYFRPPFGVTTPHLAKALSVSGHKSIGWNLRTFDTVIKNPSEVVDKLKSKLKSGSIILLHDTHNRAPYILEHLLLLLEKENCKSVTIDEYLEQI